VAQYGEALRYACKSLQADREVVMAAVTRNGEALEYAAEALRADREVVLAAVRQNGLALGCADGALWANEEVMSAAVRQNGHALKYCKGGPNDPKWRYISRLAKSNIFRRTQPRLHALSEYARHLRESKLQAQVDLFMIKNGLHDWIDAKRSRAKRQRLA
jgi:hypothetical protein